MDGSGKHEINMENFNHDIQAGILRKHNGIGAELGIFHVIFAFFGTLVPQMWKSHGKSKALSQGLEVSMFIPDSTPWMVV